MAGNLPTWECYQKIIKYVTKNYKQSELFLIPTKKSADTETSNQNKSSFQIEFQVTYQNKQHRALPVDQTLQKLITRLLPENK
jgi:hypothetical protein